MGRLARRNARIVNQRAQNRDQGRPTYAGTGSGSGKKRKPCGVVVLVAAGSVAAQLWVWVEIGRSFA